MFVLIYIASTIVPIKVMQTYRSGRSIGHGNISCTHDCSRRLLLWILLLPARLFWGERLPYSCFDRCLSFSVPCFVVLSPLCVVDLCVVVLLLWLLLHVEKIKSTDTLTHGRLGMIFVRFSICLSSVRSRVCPSLSCSLSLGCT